MATLDYVIFRFVASCSSLIVYQSFGKNMLPPSSVLITRRNNPHVNYLTM